MMFPIVAFCGQAQAGKDTAAAWFVQNRGFTRLSLADELKNDLIEQGLATHDECFVTKPPHIRKLLQWYGTDLWRKQAGADFWLWRWAACAMRLAKDARGIVCADVRFVNEARWFMSRGAILVHILPNARSLALRKTWPEVHISEEGWRLIPEAVGGTAGYYEVDNSVSLDELYVQLRMLPGA